MPHVAGTLPCSATPAPAQSFPVWDPSFTVIELDTGRELGTLDSEADVTLCLVFEKLSRDQVEVVSDASPTSSYASWD